MKNKGYIQVYTGNGKGKTTCSFGLALRAAGAGYRIFIGQFMKGGDYSEINAFKMLAPYVEIEQFGSDKFIFGNPSEEDKQRAEEGFEILKNKMISGCYDVIIADEINVASHIGLISVSDVINLINLKPENTELVLTGRYAAKEITDKADLVTEMKEIKHYYQKGVDARKGIEK